MDAVCEPSYEESIDAGGVALHVEHFSPAVPTRLVLVTVHGFGVHCGLYRHVAGAMIARGIAVTQFDCRGHGRSEGRRGHVDRFDDYHVDLSLVARRAFVRAPGVRPGSDPRGSRRSGRHARAALPNGRGRGSRTE